MRISDWSSDVCSSDLGRSRLKSRNSSNVLMDASAQAWRESPSVTPPIRGLTWSRVALPHASPLARSPRPAISIPMFNPLRSDEHTSELQSLMRNSYDVFFLKKKNNTNPIRYKRQH